MWAGVLELGSWQRLPHSISQNFTVQQLDSAS
jgi:hypothetical protein